MHILRESKMNQTFVNLVPGVSASKCRSALEAVNWDTSTDVRNLKVDRLYWLGVAEKAALQKVLENASCDLERVAAVLLDQWSS